MADNADIANEMMQNRLEGALAKRPPLDRHRYGRHRL